MNDNAKKWVAALRSGEYSQGRNYLQTKDGSYCCLGVACELYSEETGKKWSTKVLDPSGDAIPAFLESHDVLPFKVQQWLGLKSDTGMLLPGTSSDNSLAELNDSGEWDFNDIANAIEDNQGDLFR